MSMIPLDTIAQGIPPAAASRMAAKLLNRHSPHEIAEAIEVLIDMLDLIGGDPDLEGECSEDEVSRCTDVGLPVPSDKPGCDIADTGENAWAEWHTRGRHKLAIGGYEIAAGHEDAEDDDPAGQYDEDCWTGPAMPDRGAGCPISDPGEYEDGF